MITPLATGMTILALVTIALYVRANRIESSKSIGYSLLATVFFVATATCISVLISMLAGATAGSGLVTGLIISIGLQFSTLRSKWRIYAETKESTSE